MTKFDLLFRLCTRLWMIAFSSKEHSACSVHICVYNEDVYYIYSIWKDFFNWKLLNFIQNEIPFIAKYSFLAHLSRRLKWAFLIKICPLSVVVVVVVVVVVNFSHFHLLLQNHWANFNKTWHKASLGKGDSSLFKWRTPPFPKVRYLRNSENTLTKFKKSSSPEPLAQFQPNLAQSILVWRGYKFVQMKSNALFQGEIILHLRN